MKLSTRSYKRDVKIMEYREERKWTFVQIGKKLDITPARARQLYVRMAQEREKAAERMGIGAYIRREA